jgi:CubicO group peptidase (beta-lactamase class C family)
MKKTCEFILFFSLLLSGCSDNQTSSALPRGVPEEEGVSSESILEFIEAAEKSKHEFHSLMILRHGKVVAEGWWDPFSPELKHSMASVSKSWASTATGFAVDDNLLSLEDRVISFFPEYLPDTVSPYLEDLTVKHLLTMSVGQDVIGIGNLPGDVSWIKAFLETPVNYEPGTVFQYNSLCSYMLSAIIQKLTGEKLVDFLRPRLFEPLGIEGVDWEEDPQGINTGGWGLSVKTEDMAKLGQLYLQKGMWSGSRILSEEWIEEATTFKINSAPDPEIVPKDKDDWAQGYGYQFWRCRHNGFRASGNFGQFIIVMPDLDAVIVLTSKTVAGGRDGGMRDQLNLVWEYLLPAMHEDALPENKKLTADLKEKLSSLSLPLPDKRATPSFFLDNTGKSYQMEPNRAGIETMSFNISDDIYQLTINTETDVHQLSYGYSEWYAEETSKNWNSLFTGANTGSEKPFKVAGYYNWGENDELILVMRYIESPHFEKLRCMFRQNQIMVELKNSRNPRMSFPQLMGELEE